ncbi:glycosyltransferase involved in cell wall biosynthesis [Peribacillus deserti]|uniref:Glycosyltransferase involved in cell wall biosynthesis n=1 Tax=Peribacillus deserti TaxID=673318 RepID=A0ABS2QC58_9BACI|nr:glycosyltransferase [Peribacillus deserti]MBM7690736.1 glycosyltransferase involved in cell wall biosynthesis [Peribacillus deserti]
MPKRNIVFVINEYNGHGGAQRVASILAEDFVQDGHNVAVLSINEQKDESSYFSRRIPVTVLHQDGYRAPIAKELSSNLKALKFKTVTKELKRRRQLSKKRKEIQKFFDAYGQEEVFVIVIQVWGMQWIQHLLYQPNIKIIGQSHESVAAAKSSHRYKRILRYYRQVSKFLLLTEKDAEYFQGLGFSNAGVMYNPSPFREEIEPDVLYKNKTIVSTGRLIDDKGFDVLIEAFAKASPDMPGWKLHIYGEGPAKSYLQSLIHILGMEDHITLKGQTADTQSALTASSFFLLASKAEGLPMSLIEAQACGLPCISTDCAPGIREIVGEYNNGLLAPVGDVPLLSRHIKRLATDYGLFFSFSKNAYEHSKIFDKQVIKNQWYDLFAELGGQQDGK